MKKLLIICLALIVFLTSCDLSYFKDWGKTPDTEVGGEESNEEEKEEEKEPELPHSEMVALSDLINRDDVVYVEFQITFFMEGSILSRHTTDNVDGFLELFLNKNSDLQFVCDIEDVYDLYDEKMKVSFDLVKKNEYYVNYYLLDSDGHAIAGGVIYPDSTIGIIVYKPAHLPHYISSEASNTDVNTFIDYLSTLIEGEIL